MKPYYQDEWTTIYHADARSFDNILGESIITDPVWPNSVYPHIDNPKLLLSEVLEKSDISTKRIVIHLGCNSDPRFLEAVPKRFPFFRVCWLELALPNYLGRLLYTSDVAYAFGEPPPSKEGARVIPGKIIARHNDPGYSRGNGRNKKSNTEAINALPHPTPRKPEHLRWLVKYFGGLSVCDPFMGSGVTAFACNQIGVPFVGIEIEERYCELAVSRLSQGVIDFERTTA